MSEVMRTLKKDPDPISSRFKTTRDITYNHPNPNICRLVSVAKEFQAIP